MSSNHFRPKVQAILDSHVWQQIRELENQGRTSKNRIIFKDMAEYGVFQAMFAQGFGHVVCFVDLVAYEHFGEKSHPWGNRMLEVKAINAMQVHWPICVLLLEDQLEGHRLACKGLVEFEFEFRFN